MMNMRGPYYLKNSEGIQNTKDHGCRGNHGQNTIEYLLLFVAVVLVFIVFLAPQGPFHRAIEHTLLNGTIDQIQSAIDRIHL